MQNNLKKRLNNHDFLERKSVHCMIEKKDVKKV
jgi:ABC-type lipoprotein export system ATPase subunit